MRLHLLIKAYITSFLLVLSCYCTAQNESGNNLENISVSKTENSTTKNFGPRWTLSIDGAIPITSGKKYMGLAMKGKSAYSFRGQLFLYKNFFLAFSFGRADFETTDTEIVGNYKRTRVLHETMYLGYEVLTTKSLKAGVQMSIYGESQYRNKYNGSDEAYQRDSGRVRSYEAYLAYNFNKYISVNLIYAYRNDKMNIDTSPELESRFDKAQFHSIGLGLKFHFGTSDLISAFTK